jgi:hypothetical protein
MNSIERRTLEGLRLAATGRVFWDAASHRIRFSFIPEGEYLADYAVDCSSLTRITEDLYERVGWRDHSHGPVALTDEGRRLLAELESEATR